MNWYKRNIRNKYTEKTLNILGKILLGIGFIAILFNFFGDYSYNLFDGSNQAIDNLLEFRNNGIIIFTIVWLCSMFLNKKLMVIVWLIAFSQFHQESLRINELCHLHAAEYCEDNNCNTDDYIKANCST